MQKFHAAFAGRTAPPEMIRGGVRLSEVFRNGKGGFFIGILALIRTGEET